MGGEPVTALPVDVCLLRRGWRWVLRGGRSVGWGGRRGKAGVAWRRRRRDAFFGCVAGAT